MILAPSASALRIFAVAKKGIHPLVFVGGGCLVVIVIGVVVVAVVFNKGKGFLDDFRENPGKVVAEMAVKNNPDLDFRSTDEEAGTITFFDRKKQKEITVDWSQFKDGKLVVREGEETTTVEAGEGGATITGPDGTTTIGGGGGVEELPEWLEVPEGITNWRSGARQEQADGKVSGYVTGESSKPVAELSGEVESKLTAAGFTAKAKSQIGGRTLLAFEDDAKQRSVSITLTEAADTTTVTIAYHQR